MRAAQSTLAAALAPAELSAGLGARSARRASQNPAKETRPFTSTTGHEMRPNTPPTPRFSQPPKSAPICAPEKPDILKNPGKNRPPPPRRRAFNYLFSNQTKPFKTPPAEAADPPVPAGAEYPAFRPGGLSAGGPSAGAQQRARRKRTRVHAGTGRAPVHPPPRSGLGTVTATARVTGRPLARRDRHDVIHASPRFFTTHGASSPTGSVQEPAPSRSRCCSDAVPHEAPHCANPATRTSPPLPRRSAGRCRVRLR